jgi:hypothetical protein
MEWRLGLDGRDFSDLEAQKQHIIQRTAPTTEEGWCALAALATEVIGLREVVRLGDPRLWRQAISELGTLPLPPLNLPLPLWDLYQTHPFEGVTLRMQDGQQVAVPSWSKLYYSWHSRWFALSEDKVVKFYDATQVAGGESIRPPAAQTTVLERLLWLQRAEKPVDFVVRTRQGRGFIVQGNNRFRLDQSGSLLIIKQCEDQPVEILYLSDIVSVVLASTEPKVLIEQLQQKLKATPFSPFHVVLLHGGSYTVGKSQDVLITSETLFLGQGREGSEVHNKVLEIPISWIDRLEALPS